MEQAQAQAIRDSALPYVSRVLDGGENLNDVMAEIYSAYFSNNAPGDICDRILAGVKSWDDNFQAAQKNPDEFVKKFQDQLEEGKTDLERCKLWLDFITGLAGDTEQENIVIDENIKYEWARIPHFYYNFYVFQYATGFSAAIALSQKILKEGEPAVKKYLEFLSGGCSKEPLELLKGAGVDLTTAEPINDALKLFGELIDEMDELLK